MARAHDPRYKAYKRLIRLTANVCGVPDTLSTNSRVTVIVNIFWKRRARIDNKNVRGAIEDALWTQDRRILEGYDVAHEHNGIEYATVAVQIREGTDAKNDTRPAP